MFYFFQKLFLGAGVWREHPAWDAAFRQNRRQNDGGMPILYPHRHVWGRVVQVSHHPASPTTGICREENSASDPVQPVCAHDAHVHPPAPRDAGAVADPLIRRILWLDGFFGVDGWFQRPRQKDNVVVGRGVPYMNTIERGKCYMNNIFCDTTQPHIIVEALCNHFVSYYVCQTYWLINLQTHIVCMGVD